MADITAAGAWTTLNFDTSLIPKTVNERRLEQIQHDAIVEQDLPELDQFIQAMADGYNISNQAATVLMGLIGSLFTRVLLRASS